MIIAEVFVPSIDKTYDFKFDEDVIVSVVAEEIGAIICQKEQCNVLGDKDNIMLFKAETNQILSMGLSLYENGIKTGDRLMFV